MWTTASIAQIRRTPRASRTWPEACKYGLTPFVPPALRGLSLVSCRVVARAVGCACVALWQSLTALSVRTQATAAAWLLGWWIAIECFAHGAPYVLVSVLVGMLTNLGDRAAGQMSAYSVFNENYTRLLGETDPEQLAREMVGGAGMAMMARAGGGGGGGGDDDGLRRRNHARRARRPRQEEDRPRDAQDDAAWRQDVNVR
jgi:hypothetical protein